MAQRHLYRSLLGAVALASLMATGCTEDPVFPSKSVRVSAPAMPRLAGNAHYELWFSYPASATDIKYPSPDHKNASYFSVGKFRVDAEGNLVTLNGAPATFAIPEGYNANLIGDALLTVERSTDTDSLPGSRMMAAMFEGTPQQAFARLEMDDNEAFGNKIRSETSGTALLDAPTSDNPADAVHGLWFVRFVTNGSGAIIDTAAGLTVAPMPLNPDNPEWSYQSWLVRNEGSAQEEYIKLGRFANPGRLDSTGAGSGAGLNPSRVHSAPGEDFVGANPQRTLNDGTYGVIVSVEPTGIELDRPLIQVLKLDKIPSGQTAKTAMTLVRPVTTPYLEVYVDR